MPRRRRNARRRPRQQNNVAIKRSLIPSINSQPAFRQVFRFRATSALVSTIFTRCFVNILHFAISSTVSTPIIGSFCVKKVVAYTIAEGGSGTEVNTVAITFYGGNFGKNSEFTATGSSAMPGVVSQKPPAKSLLGFWHSNFIAGNISAQGEPLLLINSQTTGVIVDVHLQFTLIDGTGYPSGGNLTCSGATSSTLYSNYLDNSTGSGASGNQNLMPVGRGSLAAFG